MRKVLILALIALSATVVAQDASKSSSSPLGLSKGDGKTTDRLVLNFIWNNWLEAPSGVSVNVEKSRSFGFYLMADKKFKTDGNFGFAYGLGIQAHSIESGVDWGNLIVDSVAKSKYSFKQLPADLQYKKNKVVMAYLDLPLELRFRSSTNEKGKSFKVYGGFVIGVLINSHTKYKDLETKYKEHNLKNIESIRYGLTTRIGYGNLSLYGYYGLSNIFKDGIGADIVSVTGGITYTLF